MESGPRVIGQIRHERVTKLLTANKEKPDILYLITARGGSTRLPGKNLMKIGDHSLIAYKAISARARDVKNVALALTEKPTDILEIENPQREKLKWNPDPGSLDRSGTKG